MKIWRWWIFLVLFIFNLQPPPSSASAPPPPPSFPAAGLRCWVTSAHEGCSVPTKTPGTEKLTFGTEGEGRTLRSTSLRSATCEASKVSPSGDRRRQSIALSAGRRWQVATQKHKLKYQDLRRRQTKDPIFGRPKVTADRLKTVHSGVRPPKYPEGLEALRRL